MSIVVAVVSAKSRPEAARFQFFFFFSAAKFKPADGLFFHAYFYCCLGAARPRCVVAPP
jgi:hypothetical protein